MATTGNDDEMYAGDKRTIALAIVNGPLDPSPGTALNLTGKVVRYTLSEGDESEFSRTSALVKDSATIGGITITDAVGGLASVALLGADTVDLAGSYRIEIRVIDGDGEGVVVGTGTMTILKTVAE